MRAAVLYAYPPEPDGLSLQGDLLYRGLKENGESVVPVHLCAEFQKEWVYKNFKPDVAYGVGFWGHTPDIIEHPQHFGIKPVPWLVADGWVANYQKKLSELPLVLVTSEWVKTTYARDGVDTKNFEVAHIGFEKNIFRPIPKNDPGVRQVKRQLGIRDDELVILTMGGDVTSKGAQEILQALKKLQGEFKNWKYVCKVWGGGSADDHYEDEMRLIEELGEDSERVIYLEGPMAHEFIPYLLNACDIYAAPARLEGYGMIQMEAQACGKPVISIDAMGPKEVVMHGESGFLARVASTVELTEEWAYTSMGFDEDHKIQFDAPKTFAYRADVDEIAMYLSKLMSDEKLRETMGARGQERMLKEFEYHTIAKKIADLTEERLNLR